MSEFPVPLDNLIAYVKTLHPDGGPLDNVADAFAVSGQLDEQADALIGYFVDQARRSGASWSQIGGAMGVSKQAAQKRFVPTPSSSASPASSASKAADLFPEGFAGQPFSHFTIRAANALASAGKLAAPLAIEAEHLTAALLTETEGIAAKIVAAAGLTPEQVCAAVGAGPATKAENAGSAALLDLSLSGGVRNALKGALRSALSHGHNYIGTEHLLVGIVDGGGPTAEALASLGLTAERTEELFAAEMAAWQGRKAGN
jgi:hypothetical protein